MSIDNQQPAQFPAPGEIRILRLLPGPIERVWAYLTEPDKRAQWFAGGPMELKPGGAMTLIFRHANLAPDETPPEEYRTYHDPGASMDGRVLRCEPPHLLAYTFGDDSEVTFELTPQGEQVRLLLIHRSKPEDYPYLSDFASGWHNHTDHLLALLEHRPRPPFWPTHIRLKTLYAAQSG